MQPNSYKICPQCQTPAALIATQCAVCGRQYRTQFAEQTQVITPPTPVSFAAPVSKSAYSLPRWAQVFFVICALPTLFIVGVIFFVAPMTRSQTSSRSEVSLKLANSITLRSHVSTVVAALGKPDFTSDDINDHLGRTRGLDIRHGIFYSTENDGLLAIGLLGDYVNAIYLIDTNGNKVWAKDAYGISDDRVNTSPQPAPPHPRYARPDPSLGRPNL